MTGPTPICSLPADPWLRVHARLGGRILKVCPASMSIPGGLVPIQVSVEHDHAVYVEPNVWMHHPT